MNDTIGRPILGPFEPLRQAALRAVESGQGLALLLARLSVGLLFLSTGWGKVNDLAKVTEFFKSLGIPAPGLNAVVVGYSELICGGLLVIGLLTRLATIPLAVSMVVAILTAKWSNLHGVFDLVGFDEFTYLCMLVVIAVLGPGRVSVDSVVLPFLGSGSGKSGKPRKIIAT